MKRRPLLRFCTMVIGPLIAAAPSGFGQGGPPMITDDPGTPGNGHWEINVATTVERRPGEHVAEMPLLDLNYGIGDRVQLKYEGSWLVKQAAGESETSGPSDSLVGVKWRFYDGGEHQLAVSTYPQLGFANPGSRSADRGLTEGDTILLVPFEFQKDLGPLEWNAEVGREFHRHGGDDIWLFGLAAGHSFGEKLELAAEIHGTANAGFGGAELTANFGLRMRLAEHCTLLVSVGREFHNDFEPRLTLIGYLGLQWTR